MGGQRPFRGRSSLPITGLRIRAAHSRRFVQISTVSPGDPLQSDFGMPSVAIANSISSSVSTTGLPTGFRGAGEGAGGLARAVRRLRAMAVVACRRAPIVPEGQHSLPHGI